MIITSCAHCTYIKDDLLYNACCCNNFEYTFHFMTVGLLNTAGFHNLKCQHQGFLEHLEAFVYPTVPEISLFGIKLPDISGVE